MLVVRYNCEEGETCNLCGETFLEYCRRLGIGKGVSKTVYMGQSEYGKYVVARAAERVDLTDQWLQSVNHLPSDTRTQLSCSL